MNKAGAPVVAAIILLFVTCTKNAGTRPVYVNSQLKQYFNYLPGTYWAFYDSLSGATDSFTVNAVDTIPPFTKVNKTANESVNLILNSDSITMTLSVTDTYSTIGYYYTAQPSDLVSYPYLFTNNFPFDTGQTPVSAAYIDGYYYCNLLPTAQIGAYSYNNVYQIVYNFTDIADTYYVNADIGFLAMSLNNRYTHRHLYLSHYNLVR